jgi:hypothetical protein
MAKIINKRYMTKTEQSFVLYLIGMRPNKW